MISGEIIENDVMEYSCSLMNFISDNFTEMSDCDQDRIMAVLKNQLIQEAVLRDIIKNIHQIKDEQ